MHIFSSYTIVGHTNLSLVETYNLCENDEFTFKILLKYSTIFLAKVIRSLKLILKEVLGPQHFHNKL